MKVCVLATCKYITILFCTSHVQSEHKGFFILDGKLATFLYPSVPQRRLWSIPALQFKKMDPLTFYNKIFKTKFACIYLFNFSPNEWTCKMPWIFLTFLNFSEYFQSLKLTSTPRLFLDNLQLRVPLCLRGAKCLPGRC